MRMGWSWRIGRIAGIDVFVHPTFLILLIWVGVSHYLAHGDPVEAMQGVVFILALFGVVVLHELGHALAARRYGIRTRDITLLPIGGVARLERIPEVPAQELVVALAGPAVNVVIAAGIFAGLMLGQGLVPVSEGLRVGASFLQQMFWVNVSLVVFNLVPAFPMDGGRVLRALLAMQMDHVQATRAAAAVGQVFAMLFGLLGLFANPILIFVALFVWLAGAQEAGLVEVRAALAGIPVLRVMITQFRALQPDEPLSVAVTELLAGFQQDFPVVAGDRPVGILTRDSLATALGRFRPETPVSEIMQREFLTAHPHEMLDVTFARLQSDHCRTLPVVKDGHLVGLLSADSVAELLLIQQGLRNANRPGLFGRSPANTMMRQSRVGPADDASVLPSTTS